jgi:hypothetical protein
MQWFRRTLQGLYAVHRERGIDTRSEAGPSLPSSRTDRLRCDPWQCASNTDERCLRQIRAGVEMDDLNQTRRVTAPTDATRAERLEWRA